MADETPDSETTTTTVVTADPQIESRAREMGWIPKEEFRGDQSKWIDADNYVKRAEGLLPIVRAENRRLQGQVQKLQSDLSASTQAAQELRASIDDLKKFNTEVAKDRVKANRTEIAVQIKAAREAGDVERELELQDQLAEANTALRESTTQPVTKTTTQAATTTAQPVIAPEFTAWQSANPWFGAQGEERRTNYALAVAQDLRNSRPDLVGKREFFDTVTREVKAVFEPAMRQTSKVEGGNGSTRSGNGAGSVTSAKGFSDLPPEAQTVARAQVKRFVGAHKAFKTEAEWLSHYTTQYFKE